VSALGAAAGVAVENAGLYEDSQRQLPADLDDHMAGEPAGQMLAALREALSNAARHARASRVDVGVEAGSDLTLTVADDGVGIPPGARRSGLANLAERAERLGGTLRTGPADEAAGTGTALVWQAPIG
jgi:signal transduction histidine kinase